MKTGINPYLNFEGNCEEAFSFYKEIFGGEFTYIGRFKDIPAQEGMPQISEEQGNKIMHISYQINENLLLLGSDTGGEWADTVVVGNNISLSINASSEEEADKFFNELSNGGKATMPMAKTFWNAYFGMLTDKFGINWMINFDFQ